MGCDVTYLKVCVWNMGSLRCLMKNKCQNRVPGHPIYKVGHNLTGFNNILEGGIVPLTRQLLGYFATHRLLGGGGVKRPQPITREPIGAAKRTRRQTKERDETLQMSTLKLNFEVTGRVKVRSNT